jgi:mono/diheme cytochrome c family protein
MPKIVLAACIAATCAPAFADEGSVQLVDGPGRELTAGVCVTCHSLDYIPMNAPVMNRGSWDKSVHKMIDKFGAPIRPEDVSAIVAYLTAHYSS